VVARVTQARLAHGGRLRATARVGVLSATGVALLGLLSGCSIDSVFAFGWPQGGISQQSQRMFDMWIGSVIAALAVGFFVWGLIFWCVIRYRKRGDTLPAQTRYNLPIELLYSVAPFLIVSVLFYYTAVIQTDVNKTTANPDVVVDVTAFKWNWAFAYENQLGKDGKPVSTTGTTTVVPILVVPVGKRIRFVEHSPDVIHSFWVPELLFKRDVFPGNVINVFEVTINSEGRYVGRCAELCGTYHSMMNFELRSVSQDVYDKFIAAMKQGLTTPQALVVAGFTGDDAYATTTKPFPLKRESETSGGTAS
jgi:cytochrome c oxidase subunit II